MATFRTGAKDKQFDLAIEIHSTNVKLIVAKLPPALRACGLFGSASFNSIHFNLFKWFKLMFGENLADQAKAENIY